jgi:hypothetical protein
MEQARVMKKLLIGFVVTMSLAMSLLVIALFAIGELEPLHGAQVTQFFTCTGWDPSTGLPMEPVTTFPMNTEQIYACG